MEKTVALGLSLLLGAMLFGLPLASASNSTLGSASNPYNPIYGYQGAGQYWFNHTFYFPAIQSIENGSINIASSTAFNSNFTVSGSNGAAYSPSGGWQGVGYYYLNPQDNVGWYFSTQIAFYFLFSNYQDTLNPSQGYQGPGYYTGTNPVDTELNIHSGETLVFNQTTFNQDFGSASSTTTTVSSLTASVSPSTNPTIDVGQEYTFTVNPSGGVPPYTYQWYSNNQCSVALSLATRNYEEMSMAGPGVDYWCVKVTDNVGDTYTVSGTLTAIQASSSSTLSTTTIAAAGTQTSPYNPEFGYQGAGSYAVYLTAAFPSPHARTEYPTISIQSLAEFNSNFSVEGSNGATYAPSAGWRGAGYYYVNESNIVGWRFTTPFGFYFFFSDPTEPLNPTGGYQGPGYYTGTNPVNNTLNVNPGVTLVFNQTIFNQAFGSGSGSASASTIATTTIQQGSQTTAPYSTSVPTTYTTTVSAPSTSVTTVPAGSASGSASTQAGASTSAQSGVVGTISNIVSSIINYLAGLLRI